jgi:O-antigen/teichoic acid export membrane protein
VLSGIVGISMAYFGYGVWALVGQQISNIVFNTITLSFIVDWCPRCMFSFERFKDLFGFGVKLMGANLVGTIFYELKIFLVGVKYKPADLGLFNRGESLPQMISNNINNTISTVMFPALSKMQDDKKAVKSALRRSMLTSSYILMPIMFFLCSVADKIVFILLGDEWLGCVPYMRVFCVSYS